ncbi:hypothetical protein YpsIP31758_A0010 (plasmid) [Yersinia pseudotuberculosis IP 31758]|uniref:DUF4145 domain-containing protein n=1 Tax=Yersinia pseudotuberculosis serotype O:1b (strain IP 31758) TaxID=349747 RepID=A0A0U1QT92_YERP3|nr:MULTISPECIES: hypothetical protein [Yersinia pseudotuberculosis complex]ABS45601.1 hypothetical protein YpsIP31758_A0010 [Yersinia pseudotuberculosis IP 31758]
MSAAEVFKAHCPTCDGVRNCQVHGKIEKNYEIDNDNGYMSVQSEHKLLECMGCESIFYHEILTSNEGIDYDNCPHGNTVLNPMESTVTFPSPRQQAVRPEWLFGLLTIDRQLYNIFCEVYSACEHKLYISASIGLRTILDRITEILEIYPTLSLEEKMEKLQEEGLIVAVEKQQLLIVTNAENAVTHGSWSPNEATFISLLLIVEDITRRMLLNDDNISKA